MKKKLALRFCLLALVLSLSGCSQIIGNVVGSAVNTTTDRVGEEIGNRIAGALLADIGPRIIRTYTIGMMQLLFYQGGYNTELTEYEPGEYTVWESENSEYGQVMERAFLRRQEDGKEWWRLEAFSEDPESGTESHLVMEGLFEVREDGSRYIRRLRVKYPDKEEAEEVPITEENAEQWVVRAESLTEESLQGMKVGEEEVNVPAGTFNSVHYQTSAARYDGFESNWWVTDASVPGRVVLIRHRDIDEDEFVQTVELVQYGDDATESALGVF